MDIQQLISDAGTHLRHEFESVKNSNPHYAERGAETEIILSDFLNSHLPRRFSAGSGIVIDHENNISSQTDVIIYDAINSPIYRKGERVLILPNNNVASVIEVKSSLCKSQLEDAAKKIASVKRLKKAPISDVDQPVTFSSLITTMTLGIVFAFESTTSLETLADNLREINSNTPSDQWIDFVVVLDKGVIGYMIQFPLSQDLPGWFAGTTASDFTVFPIYIHLVMEELGDLTLNKFFVHLVSHLTFYRKISAVPFESVMGDMAQKCMTIQGYQHNLKRKLVPAEETHQQGNLLKSLVKFNLYSTKDSKFIGQISWMPWQDGGALSYSGRMGPPGLFFNPYYKALGIKGGVIQGGKDLPVWLSSVIPLTKEKFIEISESLKGEVVARFYQGDEDIKDFPMTLEAYDKLKSKE